jgi:dTDP-4-dehydrorhamnose 3,5-epimerase
VYVLEGEVFDVAVDVRTGSPTFGRWIGETLSARNHRQLYIPPGFAHGFCVTSDVALFGYKCTDYYAPSAELSVLWNDPEIGVHWPVPNPLLSARDAAGTPLAELPHDRLPAWTEREGGA